MPAKRTYPVALTIAGSDSGGNAGLQADLRAFHGFGVHGCTAIAALTAQNQDGVAGVLPVLPEFLCLQLEAIFSGYAVGAVKTGMLQNAGLIETAARVLRCHRGIPLVVDPVMVATSGARLLEDAAVAALKRRLLPLATLITPNLPEAEVLLGLPLATDCDAQSAAVELARRYCCAVLLKGGHDRAHPACDLLCISRNLLRLSTPVVRKPLSTHGTGCTLSAAIAAAIATGQPLLKAVVEGKSFVYAAIRAGGCVGPHAAVLGMVQRRGTACVLVENCSYIHPSTVRKAGQRCRQMAQRVFPRDPI